MTMATRTIATKITLKAAATPNRPDPTSLSIWTVRRFHRAETRKIAALMAVMALTKAKTRPEKNAGAIRGNVIFQKVVIPSAPRFCAASSIVGSICLKTATPD